MVGAAPQDDAAAPRPDPGQAALRLRKQAGGCVHPGLQTVRGQQREVGRVEVGLGAQQPDRGIRIAGLGHGVRDQGPERRVPPDRRAGQQVRRHLRTGRPRPDAVDPGHLLQGDDAAPPVQPERGVPDLAGLGVVPGDGLHEPEPSERHIGGRMSKPGRCRQTSGHHGVGLSRSTGLDQCAAVLPQGAHLKLTRQRERQHLCAQGDALVERAGTPDAEGTHQQHAQQDGLVPGRTGHLDRGPTALMCLVGLPGGEMFRLQARQDQRGQGAVGQLGDALGQHRDDLVVGHAVVQPAPAADVAERGACLADEVPAMRGPGEEDGLADVPAGPGHGPDPHLGRTLRDQQSAPFERIRSADQRARRRGLRPQGGRLNVRVAGVGDLRSPLQMAQSLRRIARVERRRQPVVMGQLGANLRIGGESRCERIGDSCVEPDPFADRKIAVDRFPDECVDEPVAAFSLDQQACREALVERGEHLRRCRPSDGRDELGVHGPRDRRDRQGGPDGRRQSVEAQPQHVADAVRDGHLADLAGVGDQLALEQPTELDHVERVAAGPVRDRRRDGSRRGTDLGIQQP